jgi:hypothetical protein
MAGLQLEVFAGEPAGVPYIPAVAKELQGTYKDPKWAGQTMGKVWVRAGVMHNMYPIEAGYVHYVKRLYPDKVYPNGSPVFVWRVKNSTLPLAVDTSYYAVRMKDADSGHPWFLINPTSIVYTDADLPEIVL